MALNDAAVLKDGLLTGDSTVFQNDTVVTEVEDGWGC